MNWRKTLFNKDHVSNFNKHRKKYAVVSIAIGDKFKKMNKIMINSLKKVGFAGDFYVFSGEGTERSAKNDKILKLIEILKMGYTKVLLVDSDVVFCRNIDDLMNTDNLVVSRNPGTLNDRSDHTICGNLTHEEIRSFTGKLTPNTGFIICGPENINEIQKWFDLKIKTNSISDQKIFVALYFRNEIKAVIKDLCSYPYIRHDIKNPYFVHFASIYRKGKKINQLLDDMMRQYNNLK